ncbi:MAG: hypothetical protein R6V58_13950 [Planctomycetota bacterium]
MLARRTILHVGLCAALVALAGCQTQSLVDAHRQARLHYDEGEYRACVRACNRWLRLHGEARPDLAPSAQFYKGLAYKAMGEPGKARLVFQEICNRYAAAPESHPAARWRQYAREQLNTLGD